MFFFFFFSFLSFLSFFLLSYSSKKCICNKLIIEEIMVRLCNFSSQNFINKHYQHSDQQIQCLIKNRFPVLQNLEIPNFFYLYLLQTSCSFVLFFLLLIIIQYKALVNDQLNKIIIDFGRSVVTHKVKKKKFTIF